MPNQEQFVIWGSAGHAKVLSDIINTQGGTIIALFDNRDVTSAIPNVPLYIGQSGFEKWVIDFNYRSSISALVAIGGNRGRDRFAIQRLFTKFGIKLPSIAHPSASISNSSCIGAGTQVLAQGVIAAGSTLGEACIVNNHASVDHECILGDGVHIAPGAVLCGCVTVGDFAFIGAGAVVLPHLTIGKEAIIGAGAVVTKDVAPGSTVVGNPARRI